MTDFADHFSDRAASYAVHRPTYPDSVADWLAAQPRVRAHAWEAGCGSGQFSALLGARFERVSATDASPSQIAHAHPHARVEYSVATAEACGLPDASADLGCAAQAAHWFALEGWFAELRRVVRPGGVAAMLTYGRPSVDPDVDRVLTAIHDDLLGPYWPARRRHVLTGYAELPFPFEPIPAPAFVIEQAWTREQLWRYIGTWSAVRRLELEGGGDRLAPLAHALQAVWPGDDPRAVSWPLTVRAGRLGRSS